MKFPFSLSSCASLFKGAVLEHDTAEEEDSVNDETFNIIRDNLNCPIYHTVFGKRRMVYADWTASGRSLQNIENFMQNEVLPFYGNTHSSTCVTGNQTTHFRTQARAQIAQAVNARIELQYGSEAIDDLVFCGSGVTAAINKLVHSLGLNDKTLWQDHAKPPVVFVGIMEHHSNLLPWRESVADVVVIREHPATGVDLEQLRRELTNHADRPLKIGSFSAASNITGIMTDTDAVAACLHAHGALACFDHASAAPYHRIDMNPPPRGRGGGGGPAAGGGRPPGAEWDASKDAVFFSGHKFLGGPGTPGVLLAKRDLLRRAVPQSPGGGTVLWVDAEGHRYLPGAAEREEGGTPDILGAIRLGLIFQTMERVGWENIKEREEILLQRAKASFAGNPNIKILGLPEVHHRLPIFSFLVKVGDKFLHPYFVSALLNNLFGVQTRSGCACAGPYAIWLLGIQHAEAVRAVAESGAEAKRPGFTRLSLCYAATDAEVEYTLQAVHHVAKWGYLYLPHYSFSPTQGTWAYSGGAASSQRPHPPVKEGTTTKGRSATLETVDSDLLSDHGRDAVAFHDLDLFSLKNNGETNDDNVEASSAGGEYDKCWDAKPVPEILSQVMSEVQNQTNELRLSRLEEGNYEKEEKNKSIVTAMHTGYWFWAPQDIDFLKKQKLVEEQRTSKDVKQEGTTKEEVAAVQLLTGTDLFGLNSEAQCHTCLPPALQEGDAKTNSVGRSSRRRNRRPQIESIASVKGISTSRNMRRPYPSVKHF